MSAINVSKQVFKEQGFEEVYTGKSNEVEFAKIWNDGNKIFRVRVSRNLANNSVLAQHWEENYNNGQKEDYSTLYVTPSSPRIRAALGID